MGLIVFHSSMVDSRFVSSVTRKQSCQLALLTCCRSFRKRDLQGGTALCKITERYWGLRSWDDPNLSIRPPRRPMKTSIVDGGYFIPKSQTTHDEDGLIV